MDSSPTRGEKKETRAYLLCRCLCARLSPTLVAPEHLQGLLEVAAKEAGDKQEGGYPSAVLELLLGCAASAPALFAGMSKQVSVIEYPQYP